MVYICSLCFAVPTDDLTRALVKVYASSACTKSFRIRVSSNRDEYCVDFKRLFLTIHNKLDLSLAIFKLLG